MLLCRKWHRLNARATGQMARYLSFAAVTVVGLSERSRGRYARIADFTRTSRDFSLGPKPDLQPCRCDVWFAPDSNQIVDIAASPRCVTLHPKFRWPTCTLSRGMQQSRRRYRRGSGGDLYRLPPRQARTPWTELAPPNPTRLSPMASISEFLDRNFGGRSRRSLKRKSGSGHPART